VALSFSWSKKRPGGLSIKKMFNQKIMIMNTENNTVRINLDLIEVSETNQMFRKAKDMSEKSLKDLAASIKQDGVLQSILVRPHETESGKFRLIAGERRLHASRIAGLTDIPAVIKEVDGSEAFKLQMVENLQRENIHPLNEAEGFKYLLDNDDTMTTAELALKFGKSETYILQRLKLNELVGEGKRDFLANRMSIGHALIIARLTKEDQISAIEHITRYQGGYGPVNSLQDYVDRNIINDLAAAPFKMDDAELIPTAGACISCPKRSGASKLLFADIKDKDRCIDRNCFFAKCQQFLFNKTKEVIETKPDVALLVDYNSPGEKIAELVQAHNIQPLKEYNDFSEHNKTGKKVKGLWISGSDAGKMQTIYLTKNGSKSELAASESEGAIIAKIQQRVNRGRELDSEKVYAKILECLKTHSTQQKDCNKKLLPDEEVFLWFVILDKAKWDLKLELKKAIGVSKDSPEKLYDAIKHLSHAKKAFILRRVMLDQYGGLYPDSEYAFIIKKIAKAYCDIDIKSFEKEQEEVRSKREARAKERISTLRKAMSAKKDAA
jgi:ParB/RepB/Spo0J family partition protein